MTDAHVDAPAHFIRHLVARDVEQGRHKEGVVTRFPPEPNGYLHIGHAKSICLNFGIASEFNGRCNLRFDDTNPEKESQEYIDAIMRDVEWLGFSWSKLCFASDYFEQLYQYAEHLIRTGHAYVDSSSAEQIQTMRGTLTEPGKHSPFRERDADESLALFRRMRAGEFAEGTHVLRAKIDMSSGNLNMRDPVLYRIRFVHHHRTGDAWCIYPLYDFTHCISDAIEGVTHSLCTLEFADHRPLYDWVLEHIPTPSNPEQTEFARLQLGYTMMSKRKLQQLVEQGVVDAWDDPRMPTIAGLRRRGFPASALRQFCERIGVTKRDAWIDMNVLEHSVREQLNLSAPRRLGVLDPIAVTLTNVDADFTLDVELPNHPQHSSDTDMRQVPFAAKLYIERDDFSDDPPPKFKRLVPGGEVRLRGAFVIRCDEVIYDESGLVQELRCSADLDTLGKKPEGRKVKGVIHWVAQDTALDAQVHVYDRLFNVENPSAGEIQETLNPDSLTLYQHAKLEPALAQAEPEESFQLERLGYFCADLDNRPGQPMRFNRTVTLRETWSQ